MPRRCWLALLPLLLLGGSGCAWSERSDSATLLLRRDTPSPIDGPHAVFEVALIERPIGDPYVNRELWDAVDEMVVDLDRRAALDDNGLRVGQLVGSPPRGFQDLLTSPHACSNPQALLLPPGRTKALYLGPVLSHSSYELSRGTNKLTVELDQARYCFDVTPAFADGGATKIAFVPKVEHGEATLPFEPSPEESSWTLRIERACKKYPELGWDVTLVPNQYLIVGARLDRPGSLGYRAFVQEEGPPLQRLLVLRSGKAVTLPQPGDGSVEDLLQRQCPPLALQALTSPIARAQKH